MNGSRRMFIAKTGMMMAGTALLADAVAPAASAALRLAKEEDVTPTEDLMREHGLLDRVLLIYDDAVFQIKSGKNFPPDALNGAAKIIKEFIEDYHEKNEEEYLFKRFEKAKQHIDLVSVLLDQHDAGRTLTGFIMSHSSASDLNDGPTSRDVVDHITAFTRMYRPHKSREDTILFPAFKKLVSEREYQALGDAFEKEEQKKFGSDGFASVLRRVEEIEKTLGIYDLAKFTPGK